MTLSYVIVGVSWLAFAVFAFLRYRHVCNRLAANAYQHGWDDAIIEHHFEPQMRQK